MDIDWEAWKNLLGEWESDPKNEPNQGVGRVNFSVYLQGKARKTGIT
jgi:hypothetical protein